MSIRTLVEINHDYAHTILRSEEFSTLLHRYLAGGDKASADELEHLGFRVISQRHHSGQFHINEGTDGFPAKARKP